MLRRTDLPRLVHRLLGHDRVAIVMYHAVIERPLPVPDWCFVGLPAFREQMAYLKAAFQVIPLSEVPTWNGGTGRPAVALTFDDGFENNYTTVFPILRELELPATIFLATGLLDSDDTPWFCRVHDAVSRTSRRTLTIDGLTLSLADGGRQAASAALQEWLKQFPAQEIEDRTRELVAAAGGEPEQAFRTGSPYRMLRSWQVREMAASGLVDFGAHTVTHAILSRLSPPAREKEIADSVRAVGRLLERPCHQFAYPNGTRDAFRRSDMALVSAAGIRLAVTTIGGPATPGVPALALPRYGIGADMSFRRFRLVVHHVRHSLSRWLRPAAAASPAPLE